MKIVHISSAGNGGAGIAAMRLHKGLLEKGFDSSVVQPFPITEEDKKLNIFRCTLFHNLYYRIINKLGLVPYITNEGILRRRLKKHPQNYNFVSSPFSYFAIDKHPIVKEADIIHLHWISDFLDYPSFFKNVNKPIVWTQHDINGHMGMFHYQGDKINNPQLDQLDSWVLLKKTKAILQSKNLHVVCLSNWMKAKCEKSKSLSHYPLEIIPNGLDFPLTAIPDRKTIKSNFEIDKDQKTLLFVAQNISNQWKGFDLLDEALQSLTHKINLVTLGNNKPNITNPNINHLHFDSTDDQMLINSIYTVADATVLPSKEDNLPNVMVESLANGTPIICFSNGGMADHITTGVNGIRVNDIDSKTLLHAINEFLEDKYKFDRNDIIKYASDHLNREQQVQKYIDLYQSILNNKQ